MQVDPQAPELVHTDFLAMMNATSLCVLIHDAETHTIIWANPAACELLEWSVTELRPLKADQMSSSAQEYDRVIGRAWLQEAVEKGRSRIEWHYRSSTGRVVPTEAVATRVELAQGPAVMVQFRDIEREQAVERELRQTTAYVETLSRHTAAGVVVLSPDGVVQHVTDQALAQFGVSRTDMAGHRLDDVASVQIDRRGDRERTGWAAAVGAADPIATVRLRLRRRTGAGPSRSAWLGGTLERMHQPGIAEFVLTVYDISERVRAEQAYDQENYLARYNAMGDMAMAIAHELGQPLAAANNFLAGVRARARTLEGCAEIAGATEMLAFGLDGAERQIERAATIVSSVRSYVGHLEQVSGRVDLNDVVEECLYFVGLRADPAGIEVELDLCSDPVPVRCERVLTGQVVLNLCFNAVDELSQCEPGSRVLRISTSTATYDGKTSGMVTVEDRGRGLTQDPFAESFTSKERGSGIGLALSYRIITRQHGMIWAESREGGGTRFAFTLPRA